MTTDTRNRARERQNSVNFVERNQYERVRKKNLWEQKEIYSGSLESSSVTFSSLTACRAMLPC